MSPPMPSKRNSTVAQTQDAQPHEAGAETQAPAPRATRTPRASRGAAAIPAPRKTELHRVFVTPRPPPSREQIACRAYEIWIQSGCVVGRDDENWLQAERELSAGC
jgi:DUF2934 family protein